MKEVLSFIRNNPLNEGEFYNHIQNIFGVVSSAGIVKEYIYVGIQHTYFVEDGYLYDENNYTGSSKRYKI